MSKRTSDLRLNRRCFLEISSGVAGGMLMPYLWTGARAAPSEAKNDRINAELLRLHQDPQVACSGHLQPPPGDELLP